MATLTFTKNAKGWWESSFTASGRTAVQIDRDTAGILSVYASVGDCEERLLATLGKEDLLFEIDVPSGVKIKLVSTTEVTKGEAV